MINKLFLFWGYSLKLALLTWFTYLFYCFNFVPHTKIFCILHWLQFICVIFCILIIFFDLFISELRPRSPFLFFLYSHTLHETFNSMVSNCHWVLTTLNFICTPKFLQKSRHISKWLLTPQHGCLADISNLVHPKLNYQFPLTLHTKLVPTTMFLYFSE